VAIRGAHESSSWCCCRWTGCGDFRRGAPRRCVDPAIELLLKEIRTRLRFLCEVGVGYLTLDRQSRTLSGGEVQRINLTTALGTSLVNTLFVLDEPSIGLHPRDNASRDRRDAAPTQRRQFAGGGRTRSAGHAGRRPRAGPGTRPRERGDSRFEGTPAALLPIFDADRTVPVGRRQSMFRAHGP